MAEKGDMDDIHARLDALRASGVAECDPIRFSYLDALTRRAATQPEPVRMALSARIRVAAGELASRQITAPVEIAQTSSVSPLADLLAYISQHADEPSGSIPAAMDHSAVSQNLRPNPQNASRGRARQAPELKSVAYFRNEWSKLSTEQQLTQTLAQAPENAGPMNSQHLVLRSLQVMHEIAPDYLQGFMSYIDTLIWLEHADPTKLPVGRSSGGEGENKTRTAKRRATNR